MIDDATMSPMAVNEAVAAASSTDGGTTITRPVTSTSNGNNKNSNNNLHYVSCNANVHLTALVSNYPGCIAAATAFFPDPRTRVLHPLRFFKLEDTAGIIIALVSPLMSIPAVIRTGDSFYADMRVFNENS